MQKHNIINELEMNDLGYSKELLTQVKENAEAVSMAVKKYKSSQSGLDLAMMLYEMERMERRNEILMDLVSDLIEKADEKVQKVVNELYQAGAEDR